ASFVALLALGSALVELAGVTMERAAERAASRSLSLLQACTGGAPRPSPGRSPCSASSSPPGRRATSSPSDACSARRAAPTPRRQRSPRRPSREPHRRRHPHRPGCRRGTLGGGHLLPPPAK